MWGVYVLSKKSIAVVLLTLLVFTVGLAGCGQKAATPAEKILRVGAETTFPPFESQDENSKEYVGFDMDLMKAIGAKIGYKVEISSMGFDALIPALEAKNIDVIASAMTINEERAKKVIFSKPYYKSGLSAVVRADNTTINSFKDLEGKKIAVQIGNTGAEEARKIAGTTVKEFNTTADAYMELKAGGADAVIIDLPVNQNYLAKAGAKDARLLGDVINSEDYGLAVAKTNTELADKINKALDELKQNGEYDKIYQKWFGKKPDNK